MIRQYKSGDLLRTVRGTDAEYEESFTASLSNMVPDHILKNGLDSIRTHRGLNFTGARYLWAYLNLIEYKAYKKVNEADFYLFGVTLRRTLGVIYKTLRRYIMEAWRALSILGIKMRHPRETGLLSAVSNMKYPGNKYGTPRLDYCSISGRL